MGYAAGAQRTFGGSKRDAFSEFAGKAGKSGLCILHSVKAAASCVSPSKNSQRLMFHLFK